MCMCLAEGRVGGVLITQIQTCLRVFIGPGFVLTSPVFMRSSTSHPAGLHGWLAHKTVIGPPLLGREGSTQFAQGLTDHCDRSTACRLCCLEPHLYLYLSIMHMKHSFDVSCVQRVLYEKLCREYCV